MWPVTADNYLAFMTVMIAMSIMPGPAMLYAVAAGMSRGFDRQCHDKSTEIRYLGFMPIRSEKIDLRLSPESKRILTAAAQATRRSVSDFVLESALSRAEEALPERQHFRLDGEQWLAFQQALDSPVRSLPRLRRLLTDPSPFD